MKSAKDMFEELGYKYTKEIIFPEDEECFLLLFRLDDCQNLL